LAEDLDAAASAGKHLAVMWELRGCPYCRQTHLVNFSDRSIAQFIQQRFEILQLNILGAREVTDFDGETLPEKSLARKYDVRSTPTFQFFPTQSAGLKDKPPQEREAFRAQGYLPPRQFQAMFGYIAERGYERGPPAEDFTGRS
jgi:thioredoxin-related protein